MNLDRATIRLCVPLGASLVDTEQQQVIKEARVNVRVSLDLLKRIDALIPKVRTLPELALLSDSVDRSKVARVALLRGVAALEAETARGAKR